MRIKHLLLAYFTSILLLASCNFSANTNSSQKEIPTLNVIYGYWPPDTIVYLAQEKGIFQKNGLDVNLVWGDGITEAIELRKEQEIHIWNYPLVDMIVEYSERKGEPGYEPQAFLVEDFSAGADGVITLPENNFKSIADLNGKKVGVEQGTIGEFFLGILLQREGLALEDVEIINLSFDEIPGALKKGEIHAGVTYEPALSQAIAEGAQVLADSTQERGLIVDVYIGNREHMNQHPEAYEAFAKSFLEAAQYFENNKTEAAEILKNKLEMSTEEVVKTFEKLKIADLRDNMAAFNRSSGFSSLYNLANLARQYLEDQGVIDEFLDVEELINSDIVEAID